MILYLDTSALVKRYIREPGSEQVEKWISSSDSAATGLITRAEVASAVATAVRRDILTREEGQQALQDFRADWPDFVRLPLSETTVARAENLAWELGLRGYDAVHLATSLIWNEAVGESMYLATFDRHLWRAARHVGLSTWPEMFAE